MLAHFSQAASSEWPSGYRWQSLLAAADAVNLLTDTPAEAALVGCEPSPSPQPALALNISSGSLSPAVASRSSASPRRRRTALALPAMALPAMAAAAAQQQAEMWSIIEEAARQWIGTCADQERVDQGV
jgi:hypothetical protein